MQVTGLSLSVLTPFAIPECSFRAASVGLSVVVKPSIPPLTGSITLSVIAKDRMPAVQVIDLVKGEGYVLKS